MSQPNEGRYEGRFDASSRRSPPPRAAKRMGSGLLALLILVLVLARVGTEVFKLLAYADVFVGGGRMLVYGNVEQVDMGQSLNSGDRTIQILDQTPETTSEEDYILRLNDGTTIVYQGHTYELNRNLSTVLFLGIDQDITETNRGGTGGQSDVMLLVGIDTTTGQTTVLNISREAYAQVDVYSGDNQFITTRFEQITLAYAYGNGKDTSAENTLRSVSRLFYGLPISSYVALDMNGIEAANELMGGIRVKSLIDVKMPDGTQVKQGDLIELHGKNLNKYIRTRSDDVDANGPRMERQKQYLTEFAQQVIAKSRDKLTFPVDLFSSLSPYMVTNLDISDVTFLSSAFLGHGANFVFRSIDGTYDLLNGSSVYYLDELDLFESVLQMFYIRVD